MTVDSQGNDVGAAPDADADRTRDDSVLERMLSQRDAPAGRSRFEEAVVAVWDGQRGKLTDGRTADVAASCLLRPASGDRVVVWSAAGGGTCRVAVVLERASDDVAVLSVPGEVSLEASRLGLSAQTVQIIAQDFLSHTRNRHALEGTRTEVARVRVAQIGTDIRRASTADDEVTGTLLQRTGTWISKTVREARFKARTFLFD